LSGRDIAAGGYAPLAEQALVQIAALYKTIEETIRGQSSETRCKVRQAKSGPLLDQFKSWLEKTSSLVPGGSKMAKAIRYALHHWDGLVLFANDGRIEMDTNTVERSIRPLALNRKNALFAGHDRGAEHWGIIASLIETAKLNVLREKVPKNWTNLRDAVTDNFRVINPKDFRVLA
jgi:hypothetical protein